MPRLIHLNGPTGVGKSTLAQRYVEDHRGSLNLDADRILSLIGGWQDDFFAAIAPARNLAVAMATAHLRSNHDVVLPQLVTDLDEAAQFEGAARAANADYVEVALLAGVEEQISRFRGKGTHDAVHRHIGAAVDAVGGDALLRKIDGDFARYLSQRPNTQRVDASGTESRSVYAQLLVQLNARPL